MVSCAPTQDDCGLLQRHYCIERTQAALGLLLRLMMTDLLGLEAPTQAMTMAPPPCLSLLLPPRLHQTRQLPLPQVLTDAFAVLLQFVAYGSDMPVQQ